MSTFVLPLSDPQATIEKTGGKGASLAKLARAGLPVPDGFHLTTQAYRLFVCANAIQPKILAALAENKTTDPVRLELASLQIRQDFIEGAVPLEIVQAVTGAYRALAHKSTGNADIPVAVRSSATAEDLPEASFAGQQETYLNISGAEAVMTAVKQCWASLWTARAIAYRDRQGIPPETVALAVVIQELVPADASGVMFTANPINGKRTEIMISAAWGLGEAIVGGLVTPDTLSVDKSSGKVLSRKINAKRVMTVRTPTGTQEQPVPAQLRKKAVLSQSQVVELANIGIRIEKLYELPVDIEWILAGGTFAIAQARPITSLPEAPLEWLRANPKALMGRSSLAEFFPAPVSPLFATLGLPIAQDQTRKLMTDIFELEDAGSYLVEEINGYIYIGIVMNTKLLWKILVASTRHAGKLLAMGKRRWPVVRAQSRDMAITWRRDLSELSAAELLTGARAIFTATAEYYTVAQSGPIPIASMSEMIFDSFYKTLVKTKNDPPTSAYLLGCETLALRAEKSLQDLAGWVKSQPCLVEYFQNTSTALICADLKTSPMPDPLGGVFAEPYAAHQTEFGYAIFDLDFAKPVPADDPMPFVETLKACLEGKITSPYERQHAQLERREQAIRAVTQRLDPLRRKWFLSLLHWAQAAAPEREDCITDLGLGYPELRNLLLELGRRLAGCGVIQRADDIFWLNAQEADALAEAFDSGEKLRAYFSQVEARKARWQRARAASAPYTLPQQSWLKGLIVHDNPQGKVLKGYRASPGQITAPACVLRGPEDFGRMRRGDVIVTVTTTPAWTPLFALASAVVTDIGGPLSHSSIIAREYGIPAVMATGSASKRIQNGQLINVDGNAGTVTLL